MENQKQLAIKMSDQLAPGELGLNITADPAFINSEAGASILASAITLNHAHKNGDTHIVFAYATILLLALHKAQTEPDNSNPVDEIMRLVEKDTRYMKPEICSSMLEGLRGLFLSKMNPLVQLLLGIGEASAKANIAAVKANARQHAQTSCNN